jgi:hypothetical protein
MAFLQNNNLQDELTIEKYFTSDNEILKAYEKALELKTKTPIKGF